MDFFSYLPGVGCEFRGFANELLLTTLLPLGIMAAFICQWLRRKFHKHDSEAWHSLKNMVNFCKLVLPAVSSTILKSFRCQGYDSGKYQFLYADLSIDCRSGYYRAVEAYAVLMVLVFPVGLPLTAFGALIRLKPIFVELRQKSRGDPDGRYMGECFRT